MKIIDLTHVMKTGMPVFPGTKEAVIEEAFTIEKNGFAEKLLTIMSHTGTHLDCPKHMIDSDLTTDTVPLEHFFGKGVKFDCRSSIETGLIKPEQLDDEKLTEADFAIFYTGWDKYWGVERYFSGYPTFHEETIDLLLKHKIKAVGLDFISADRAESTAFENHKRFLPNGCLIVENLTNLEQLPETDFYFSCFPLKILEGDGSPVRAAGIIL
ncbi:MAG TPA: cyclase family protein [Thermotogota bacterium]|nr:cyclase family protein [Thermotogota bacterium]HPJ88746.1 cyclase family protein [Thermotogota bacterium]HPR95707.1 cyclase family protein [Thermotogota bacterium]